MLEKRFKKEELFELLTADKDKKIAICLIDDCGKELFSHHTGNLQSHIRHKHPGKYAELGFLPNEHDLSLTSNSSLPTSVVAPSKVEATGCNMSRFMETAVNMVITGEVSLSFFNGKNWRAITRYVGQNILGTLSINTANVRLSLQYLFSSHVKEIGTHAKGRFISLKMDIATRHTRTILGINMQYFDSESKQIVIKTLCMKKMEGRASGHHIDSIIKEVLKDYDLKIEQIINITTDNGSNMLKTVSILNETKSEEQLNIELAIEDEFIEDLGEVIKRNIELLIGSESLSDDQNLPYINQMRCVAHTL